MLVDVDGIVRFSDELNRVHFGKVVANEDPKKLGRVKVEIEFIYTGSVDDLPWVYPNINSPSVFDVPEIGEKLKIIFRNGDIYHPEYIGFYHTTVNHDVAFDVDYPNTFGVHKQGFTARYNKKSELLEIIAKNGSFIKMNKDGDTTFNTTKDYKVTATGDVAFTAGGKVDLKSTGNMTITSDGEATFSGKSKTTVGDASSMTMVNGSMVMLAGGGSPIALVGSQGVGIGNMGAPVVITLTTGSSKVTAPT